MFDQTYFSGGLKAQVDKIGGNPVVEVALLTGERYFVRSVDQATSGWVVLDVHPRPGSSALQRGPQVLTIPYATVASVLVSGTTVEQSPKIGFSAT